MGLRLAPIAQFAAQLVAQLAALLVALSGVLTLAAPRGAAAADRTRIVVLPIVVHTAAAEASYVSRGISDMIASRLEQTNRVSVDRVEDPGAATTLLGKALRLGQSRGGDYLIFGAFTQFGDGASLDVHCIPLDVKNEAEAAAARRIFIQSGAVGDIIPKLDEIVDRVAVYVKAGPLVGPDDPRASDAATAAAAPDRTAADDAILRELTRRLDALEKAVFSGDASTAAQQPEPPPES